MLQVELLCTGSLANAACDASVYRNRDFHYGIIPRATVSHFKIKIKFLVKVPYQQQTSPTHHGRFFVRRGGLRMTVFSGRRRMTVFSGGLRMTVFRGRLTQPSQVQF